MMLAVALTFANGRFHATPWGRHVNEGVPEWPPSPYRLVRGLYDVWKRKRPDWPANRVEPLLAALASAPPHFALPPATVSHTRSFLSTNSKDPTDRTLVFDAFVAVAPNASVFVGWPNVTLDRNAESDLCELLACLNYLGRSEAWVNAGLVNGDDVPAWNSVPTSHALVGAETVRVACPIPQAAYVAAPYASARPKKGTKAAPLSWLDALAWSTDDLIQSRRSDPPALQDVPYTRPARCFEVTRLKRPQARKAPVHGVLYALESKVPPRVTATVEIAERVRRKLMGIHARMAGDGVSLSPRFSGKDASGRPLTGHQHVYILPLDRNRDGWLDHLLIICRVVLDQQEQLTLEALTSLWQSQGKPDVRCIPLQWGGMEKLLEEPSACLTSATPFVPTRHYRKGRGTLAEWLAKEVCREATNHGLPVPLQVTPLPKLTIRGRDLRWIEFRRARKGEATRMGYGFTITFPEPVRGPIALGYGCHFGLGQFRPI
jgi:CRISPR-associated protein Csb2